METFVLTLLVLTLTSILCSASPLDDMLRATDVFFLSPRSAAEIETFQEVMERSHDLAHGLFRRKRAVPESPKNRGVLVNARINVIYSNYNSPYDLTAFENHGEKFALSLQRNDPDGGKTETPLLVLFKIEEKTSSVIQTLSLESPGILEVYEAGSGVVVVVTQENSGQESAKCLVFQMNGNALRKTQVLNTANPTDIKIVIHLEKIYLGVASLQNIRLYEWKGRHFDLVQELEAQDTVSITFFDIENSLFLATAGGREDDGTFAKTRCAIWEKNLESKMFECRQFLEAIPAVDVRYFVLNTSNQGRKEHFLAVAYENAPSVIYRHDGWVFQPFQNIPHLRNMQWVPVQGGREEFVLFLLSDKEVSTYTYDGWRFLEMDFVIENDALRGCKRLRVGHIGTEAWLMAINPVSETGMVMGLSFLVQNESQETPSHIDQWCQSQWKRDVSTVERLEAHLKPIPTGGDPLEINGNITFRHLKVDQLYAEALGGLNAALVDHVNEIAVMLKELNELMTDIDTLSLAYTADAITMTGPLAHENLDLHCGGDTPCLLPNVSAAFLNGELVMDLLSNTVSLKEGIRTEKYLEFADLRVGNVTCTHINDYPAHMLVSREGNMKLESLRVEGSVIFHGSVFVRGEIQGVLLDREHAVLIDEDQTLSGRLLLKSGVVKSLRLLGSLNGANLTRAGGAAHVPDSFDELNVLNLTLHGRIAGRPVWQLLGQDFPEGDVEIDEVSVASGFVSGVNLADLVRITNGTYRLHSDVTCTEPLHVSNLQVSQIVNDIPLATLMTLAAAPTSKSGEDLPPVTLRNVIGKYTVIVEGRTTLSDITSSEGHSLSELLGRIADDDYPGTKSFVYQRTKNQNETSSVENDDDGYGCLDWQDREKVNYLKREDELGFVVYELNGTLTINSLVANNLNITERIANVNWTELITDAVFKGDATTVIGQTVVVGNVNVTRLDIQGFINDQPVNKFLHQSIEMDNTLLIDGDLILNHVLEVEDIFVNATSLFKKADSGDEENPDNSYFPFNNVMFIENVHVNSINKINVSDLLENAIHTNENTNLDTVNFIHEVLVENMTSTGLINGADFTEIVVVKNTTEEQIIDGHWLFKDDVEIEGTLQIDGNTTGLDLNALCAMADGSPKLIVGGSVVTTLEPKIEKSINSIVIGQLLDDLWFRNEETVLDGSVILRNAQIKGSSKLQGNLNNINLEQLSKGYLSTTIPRRMQAPLFVANLTVLGPVRASKITGQVNGMNVGKFAASVLQHGVDQNVSGRLHFHELHIPDIGGDCTVNGLNLARDVLRYDVEGAIVSGAKMFENIVVEELVLPRGAELQGVDLSVWVEEAVTKDTAVIDGNVSFTSVEVLGNLKVHGTVGSINLDSKHIITVDGNHRVSSQKTFMDSLYVNDLSGDGLVNDINLKNLIEAAAYTNKDATFSSPLKMENLEGANLNIDGDVGGVNVTQLCDLAGNLTQINDLNESYSKLLTASHQVYENLAHGAFFLDHYKMVEKLRSNVTGVATVPGDRELVIAVFRKNEITNNATVMIWDDREKLFKKRYDTARYGLSGNVTLVASGASFLFTENWNHGGTLFFRDKIYPVNVASVTCAVPFTVVPDDVCLFISQKNVTDTVMCAAGNDNSLQLIESFNSTGCIQAAVVKAGNKTWLAVIGRKVHRRLSEVYVTVFSLRDGQTMFFPRQDLAVLHPVSVAAVAHGRYCYLVVASQHQPESVRSSLLSIFRYINHSDKWSRYQEISVEAPVYVVFEELPTGQLALYVLTANPARAFLTFLYRGAEGFVEETAGFATHPGKVLSAFNAGGNHFIGIAGSENGYGQLLHAELRGRRYG